MKRTFTPAVFGLLLALLLLPACSATQRHVAASTICLASIAADIAISIHNHSWAPGGLLGLYVCDLSMVAFRNAPHYGQVEQWPPTPQDGSSQ
jgi:hypothetical protein